MKITTNDAYMAIAMHVPFETGGAMRAVRHSVSYSVYSYKMEIASWRPDMGWTTNDRKVSVSTSKHQSAARYGIHIAQTWAACENAAHIERILTYVRRNEWRAWAQVQPFCDAVHDLAAFPESAALLDLTPDALRTLVDVGAGDPIGGHIARTLLPVVIAIN